MYIFQHGHILSMIHNDAHLWLLKRGQTCADLVSANSVLILVCTSMATVDVFIIQELCVHTRELLHKACSSCLSSARLRRRLAQNYLQGIFFVGKLLGVLRNESQTLTASCSKTSFSIL